MYRTFAGCGQSRCRGDNVSYPPVINIYNHGLNEDSDGLHGSSSRPSRPSRVFRIDLRDHVTAKPIGYDGQELPFTLHLYPDGSSNYKEVQARRGSGW